jgi:hypothetical protein
MRHAGTISQLGETIESCDLEATLDREDYCSKIVFRQGTALAVPPQAPPQPGFSLWGEF